MAIKSKEIESKRLFRKKLTRFERSSQNPGILGAAFYARVRRGHLVNHATSKYILLTDMALKAVVHFAVRHNLTDLYVV
jgi:hypothetical protein